LTREACSSHKPVVGEDCEVGSQFCQFAAKHTQGELLCLSACRTVQLAEHFSGPFGTIEHLRFRCAGDRPAEAEVFCVYLLRIIERDSSICAGTTAVCGK
jgi:hypothetical protein